MKKTHPRTKKLIETGEKLGFTVDDKVDGNGHVVLRHANGGHLRVASTPGDLRGDKNAVALMERISGQKLPRQVKRKGRGPAKIAGYQHTVRTPSAERWSQRITDLLTEHTELMSRLRVLSSGEEGPITHNQKNEAIWTIRRLSEIETFLLELRQPLPEDNVKTITG